MYTREWFDNWKDLEYCLKRIKENGYNIQFIKKPTEEMCMEAVRQNSYSIQCVKKPSEEVCMEAVRQTPESIQYIDIDKFPRVWKYYQLSTV